MDKVNNVSEAMDWFISNSSGSVLCVDAVTNETFEANSFPSAKRFFEEIKKEAK